MHRVNLFQDLFFLVAFSPSCEPGCQYQCSQPLEKIPLTATAVHWMDITNSNAFAVKHPHHNQRQQCTVLLQNTIKLR